MRQKSQRNCRGSPGTRVFGQHGGYLVVGSNRWNEKDGGSLVKSPLSFNSNTLPAIHLWDNYRLTGLHSTEQRKCPARHSGERPAGALLKQWKMGLLESNVCWQCRQVRGTFCHMAYDYLTFISSLYCAITFACANFMPRTCSQFLKIKKINWEKNTDIATTVFCWSKEISCSIFFFKCNTKRLY